LAALSGLFTLIDVVDVGGTTGRVAAAVWAGMAWVAVDPTAALAVGEAAVVPLMCVVMALHPQSTTRQANPRAAVHEAPRRAKSQAMRISPEMRCLGGVWRPEQSAAGVYVAPAATQG